MNSKILQLLESLRSRLIILLPESFHLLPRRHPAAGLLRRWLRRVTPTNFLHDLLIPADRVGDSAHRGGDALPGSYCVSFRDTRIGAAFACGASRARHSAGRCASSSVGDPLSFRSNRHHACAIHFRSLTYSALACW